MVFTALLTVTNEKGEIRICALVATKSHSQFELALTRMRESLLLFGHTLPTVIYTDNIASDKGCLESSFPSLLCDVVPVEKYDFLELLTIPSNIIVGVKDTAEAIDNAVRTILDSLAADGSGSIAVGFDSEWNVEMSPDGQVTKRGHTAIIQIAHGNCIFVLQVYFFPFLPFKY
jgi:hypothetical protein